MLEIKVFDNEGKTADRYTVVIDKDVYNMSIDATAPNGVNMYVGKLGEDYDENFFNEQLKGTETEFYNLPRKVLIAIIYRLIG